jgi:alpha-ketoglutarate-dependent 2,4-dichlorophenoxyacetate dioxygenase
LPEELLMPITVCPVTPGFVAEIGDIDLSTPLEPSDLLAVKEAFTTYAVLIFPEQHLSQDQHLDFARNFGPLETTIALFRKDAKLRVRKEFADVSNLDADNKWPCRRARDLQFPRAIWASPNSAMKNGRACHRCRKRWCASSLNPAANRFISRHMPAASSACRSRKGGR